MKMNKGISLIVLVITIIVMIILATTIILSLNNNEIFTITNRAVFQSDLKTFQQQLQLYIGDKKINDKDFDEASLFAYENTLSYNTITEEESQMGNLYNILPGAERYGDRIYIEAGELIFHSNGKELAWAKEAGIKVTGFYVENGVLKSLIGVEKLVDGEGELTIPSIVKTIEEGVFYNIPELKHLIIPGTVETIGAGAFRGNTYLETVEIKNGVKTIKTSAFINCTNLQNITIPDSVTTMGSAVLQGCKNLTSVKLPNKIIEIPSYTFHGCSKLVNIEIPKSVTKLGNGCFASCSSLMQLYIPENVTTIDKSAFNSSNSLMLTIDQDNPNYKMEEDILFTIDGKNIIHICKLNLITDFSIPNGVESINLNSAANLKTLVVPASVKELDIGYGLNKLESVTISEDNQYYTADEGAVYNKDKTTLIRCIYQGESYAVIDGVKTLVSSSFYGKHTLKEVTLPDSLETIENTSFYYCNNIETIHIGKSLKTMTSMGLYKLPNLTNIIISNENEYLKLENGMILSKDGTTLVKVLGNVQSFVMPSGITNIGENAFRDHKNLTSVILKEGLIKIGAELFAGCTSLTNIEIPSTVTTINNNAFKNGNNLQNIKINKEPGSISGSPWGSPYGKKAISWIG